MTRISPEAPAPIIRERRIIHQPGGAANVAVNIAAMGHPVLLHGATGPDWESQWLHEHLTTRHRVRPSFVQQPGETRSTICKTRITCAGQQVIRLDREDGELDIGQCETGILSNLQALFDKLEPATMGAIVFADYAKGTITDVIAKRVIAQAVERQIPVLVDTKPSRLYMYPGVSLLKPNIAEATEMCEGLCHPAMIMGDSEDASRAMAEHLHKKWKISLVAITSPHGVVCFDGAEHHVQSTRSEEVYDVTGAGDTFMALLVDGVVRAQHLDTTLLRASVAATLAVQHRRTFVITPALLEEALHKRGKDGGKLMSLGQAHDFAARQKELQREVVLVVDPCHMVGQELLEMIQFAAGPRTALIVALSSAEALERANWSLGTTDALRVRLLGDLASVDAVTVVDAVSPMPAVKAIRPDVTVFAANHLVNHQDVLTTATSQGGIVRTYPPA